MREFLSTYLELLQNNHDMVGQVRERLIFYGYLNSVRSVSSMAFHSDYSNENLNCKLEGNSTFSEFYPQMSL